MQRMRGLRCGPVYGIWFLLGPMGTAYEEPAQSLTEDIQAPQVSTAVAGMHLGDKPLAVPSQEGGVCPALEGHLLHVETLAVPWSVRIGR